jgi:CDP-glucose 4,6-dehydratase
MSRSFAWDESTVLVTGATGMVGSWLVRELLARGARVVALIHDADPQSELFRSGDVSRVSVVNGALEQPGTVERAINEHEVDTVFHLGAQTIVGTAVRSPVATFEANLRGSYQLLDACRHHRGLVKRVVIASSDKAYGEHPVLPYTEDMALLARHPYDVSKSCTELIAQCYFHTYDVPVAIARCGNIYGGGDLNWSRVVPGTIRSVLRGEAPVIRSDGTFVRDYLHVTDTVSAYLALAEQVARPEVAGCAFNFSTESPLNVLDVVAQIQAIAGTALAPEVRDEARSEIHSQHLSATRAREVLGWKAELDLASGLAATLPWYRAFFGHDADRT